MSRRRWIYVGLAVLAVAAALWFAFGRDKGDFQRYRTAPVARGDLTEAISANGTINPVRVINVGTQVSGTVSKLYADYNDRVRQGQVLLELDPRLYAARVAASEAQLANLRATAALQAANARRADELRRQQFISQQDYETARAGSASAAAQVRAAEAQIAQDRANLGFAVIRAPVSGVVISRQVDLGQTVAASFQTPTLFTIARDLSEMQIEAQIAEADVGRVRVGQPVDFTVDAYGERTFRGCVRQLRLNPQTVQNVVTYTAIVAVANPDGALLPGMTANAEFIVKRYAGALLLPNAALSWKPADWRRQRASGDPNERAGDTAAPPPPTDPDAATVFVLGPDGAPAPRKVKLGAADNDNTIVASGLKPGERVITGENDPAAAAAARRAK